MENANVNVNASQAIELLREEVDRGNDRGLHLKMRFCAGGEPVAAEVRAGWTPVFELPVEIETPLTGTPASAPNAEVETVKSNILGWLNLALREAARLNVEGRESMCGIVMSEVQDAMKTVRKYVC